MTQYKKYLEDNYTKGTIETYFKFKGIDITVPERKKDYSLILKTRYAYIYKWKEEEKEEIITEAKTQKSNKNISISKKLVTMIENYLSLLYNVLMRKKLERQVSIKNRI